MATVEYAHISRNSKGVPVIAGTRMKVRMVVIDHVYHGWDAMEIHRQYPHLSLGQIHSALAYYYDHKAEIDAEIEEAERNIERLKAEIDTLQGPSPLIAKLKAAGAPAVTVPLYMDHHVKAAVVEGLSARGVDVLTAAEDGCAEMEDEDLLARSTELGRVVFTQDDDFLAIANRWLLDAREFAGIVYGHQQKISIGKAIEDLELISGASNPEDMRNQVQYLPL